VLKNHPAATVQQRSRRKKKQEMRVKYCASVWRIIFTRIFYSRKIDTTTSYKYKNTKILCPLWQRQKLHFMKASKMSVPNFQHSKWKVHSAPNSTWQREEKFG
jgi:hypothetical protein